MFIHSAHASLWRVPVLQGITVEVLIGVIACGPLSNDVASDSSNETNPLDTSSTSIPRNMHLVAPFGGTGSTPTGLCRATEIHTSTIMLQTDSTLFRTDCDGAILVGRLFGPWIEDCIGEAVCRLIVHGHKNLPGSDISRQESHCCERSPARSNGDCIIFLDAKFTGVMGVDFNERIGGVEFSQDFRLAGAGLCMPLAG